MRRIIFFLIFSLSLVALEEPKEAFAATNEQYLWQKASVVGINAQGAAPFTQELAEEIGKIISAGHLEPALFDKGLMGQYLLWGSPTEQIYILSQALPYLSEPLKSQLDSFIRQEIRAYKPWEVAFFPSNWGAINFNNGTRREYFQIEPVNRINPTVNIWPPLQVALENFYALLTYAENTGDWHYIRDNWTALNTLYINIVRNGASDENCAIAPQTANNLHRYSQISGLIGYIRLAYELDKRYPGGNYLVNLAEAQERLDTLLGDAENFNNFYRISQNCFKIDSIHDWVFSPFYLIRQQGAVAVFVSREVGRFLNDTPSAKAGLQNYTDAISKKIPSWPFWRGDYPLVGYADVGNPGLPPDPIFGGGYGENTLFTPDFAWTMFMIKAYVYGDKGDELAKYLDVPSAAKGDLYHIQRLIAAIEAYGTTNWVDVRTGQALLTGDLNNDTQVNVLDVQACVNHILGIQNLGSRGDVNSDGDVNVLDVQSIVNIILGV